MDDLSTVVSILQDLVAIPSTPGQHNTTWLRYVTTRLRAAGCDVTQVPAPDQSCSGVLARIGPDVAGGLVLSGHCDVVSVDGQTWSGDPFALRQHGTRLIGRGTADMKGFVACAIAVIEAAAQTDIQTDLRRPITLALSADEETSCQSAYSLATQIADVGPAPSGVVVGEPTLLQAINRHNGSYTYRVDVTGRPAHASTPELGANAVALAARLIAWLDDQSAVTSTKGATTHSVGVIHGGNASNIIPEHCSFEWDLRLAHSDDLDTITGLFMAQAERLRMPNITVKLTQTAAFPGFLTDPNTPFAQRCLSVSSASEFSQMSAGTEAGIFQDAGMPVIVMGPGDMAQAHTADEYIDRDQLVRCVTQLRQLV
ncbi:MAG: acetylornithine deacetylase [Roseovarius sp.]